MKTVLRILAVLCVLALGPLASIASHTPGVSIVFALLACFLGIVSLAVAENFCE